MDIINKFPSEDVINKFSLELSEILKIDKNIIDEIIKKYKIDNTIVFNQDIIDKLNKLKEIDKQIVEYESTINNNNFKDLKKNLAKLQILTIIKIFEKNKLSNDFINALKIIKASNNKFESLENILTDNLNQSGSGLNKLNYYKNNYLKYKIKYLKLKYIFKYNEQI